LTLPTVKNEIISAEAVWESILEGLSGMESAMIVVENTNILLEEWY
jgi:hypothetical protein